MGLVDPASQFIADGVSRLRSTVEPRVAASLRAALAHIGPTTPKGDNYDLPALGIDGVLTVVCTPYTEYIPSRVPEFFLTEWVPRVVTPEELRDCLSSCTPDELSTNPRTRRLAPATVLQT